MPNSFFKFKQFTVWHDKCAMKVGTDGVLLGAWAPIDSASRILDIGTGTGLVALMLAQRAPADVSVTALEIDKNAVVQARENVEHSPWNDRIEVLEGDFNSFQSEDKFDLIVSNPPYFVDSLTCPNGQRSVARHNDSLTYHNLVKGVSRLLANKGVFTIIIPMDVADSVVEVASTYGLNPLKQLSIITKPGVSPKRTLITFGFENRECVTNELVIEYERHQYSEAYVDLTKDFYLKM